MKKLKTLNYKILSTLPIMGVCLITAGTSSTAMFKHMLSNSLVRNAVNFFSKQQTPQNLSVRYTQKTNGAGSVSILGNSQPKVFYGSNGRVSLIFPQAPQTSNTTKINTQSNSTTPVKFYGTSSQRPIFQQSKPISTTSSTSSSNTNNQNPNISTSQIAQHMANNLHLSFLQNEVRFWGTLANSLNGKN